MNANNCYDGASHTLCCAIQSEVLRNRKTNDAEYTGCIQSVKLLFFRIKKKGDLNNNNNG